MSLRSRLTNRARPNISVKVLKSVGSSVVPHIDIQVLRNTSVKEDPPSPSSLLEAAIYENSESKFNLFVKNEATSFDSGESKKFQNREGSFEKEERLTNGDGFVIKLVNTPENAVEKTFEEKRNVHPVDELPVEVYEDIGNQCGAPLSVVAAAVAANVVDLDLDPGQAGDTEDSDREMSLSNAVTSQAYNTRVLDFGAVRRQETAAAQREHTRRARQVATAAGCSMDKTQMKMRDLIYWNPESKPPPKWRQERDVERLKQKAIRRQSVADCDNRSSLSGATLVVNKISDVAVLSDLDDEEDVLVNNTNELSSSTLVKKDFVAPEVVLDAHGNIVLNEESLVLRDLPSTDVIEEVKEGWNDLRATYRSFRTDNHRTRFWSDRETTRFYKALSTIGTDFSFMASVFRQRTREELKRKFKREEKRNPHLVNVALKSRRKYNLSIYDQSSDESDIASLMDSTADSLIGETIAHGRPSPIRTRRSVTSQLRNSVLATRAKLVDPLQSLAHGDGCNQKPTSKNTLQNKLISCKASDSTTTVAELEAIKDDREVIVTRMSSSSMLSGNQIERRRSRASKFIKLDDAHVNGESHGLLPLPPKTMMRLGLTDEFTRQTSAAIVPLSEVDDGDVMMHVGKDVFQIKRENTLSCVDILKLAMTQPEYCDSKESVMSSLYNLSESAAQRLEQVLDTCA